MYIRQIFPKTFETYLKTLQASACYIYKCVNLVDIQWKFDGFVCLLLRCISRHWSNHTICFIETIGMLAFCRLVLHQGEDERKSIYLGQICLPNYNCAREVANQIKLTPFFLTLILQCIIDNSVDDGSGSSNPQTWIYIFMGEYKVGYFVVPETKSFIGSQYWFNGLFLLLLSNLIFIHDCRLVLL